MDFEQVIISVISFSALFASGIEICSTQQHILLVLSCLYNPSALAADFEQAIVPVALFLALSLARH